MRLEEVIDEPKAQILEEWEAQHKIQLAGLNELLSQKGLTEVYRLSGAILRFATNGHIKDYEHFVKKLNPKLKQYSLHAEVIPGEVNAIEISPKNGPGRELLWDYKKKYTDADEPYSKEGLL